MYLSIPVTVATLFAGHQFNPLISRNDHEFVKRGNKYPYCKGSTYGIDKKTCAKFQFNANDKSNCIEPKNCTTFVDISNFKKGTWSTEVVKFAELITNNFENGNSILGFAASEILGDGRGITSGYIGFTTGTDDGNSAIQEYIHRKPNNNPFKKYSGELNRLSKLPWCGNRDSRNDTSKLIGYSHVWKEQACKDPMFVQTQLDIANAMYVKPAMRFAAQWDVQSALGFALFYDTIIQHGWKYTEPTINLPRVLSLTGDRSQFKSEKEFLTEFLKVRRQLLCCYPDTTWPNSADRVADLQSVLEKWDQNKDLKKPIELKIYGVTVKGTEDITYDTATCGKIPNGWKLPGPQTWKLETACPARK